ncbi:MAG: glycosyltransferase family 4 protein [Pyrinomonadaceae bacterium]|nr:glycosyltransferase family 4 protein [Pyrinomonadaceae bacterium]MCX7640665.1 glycosyltransferase family 4 protein [Pyrinomonadaceae bacterium]MDW8305058.1 glycosyltransferase family 4 protein [Acidobacteriota bacterium]
MCNIKKIVYAWNYKEWGGVQIYFLSLMKEALKKHQVFVVMPNEITNNQMVQILDSMNIEYARLNSVLDTSVAKGLIGKLRRHYRKLKSELVFYRYLTKLGDEKKVIFHIDFAPWQSFLFLYLLSRKNKVLFTVHNPASTSKWREILWRVKLWLLSKQKNFQIFASNELSRSWIESYGFKKAEVIYSGISVEEIKKVSRKKFFPTDKLKIICAGQFIDRKGRWEFLTAAKKVLSKHKNVTFIWLSNTPLSSEDAEKIPAYQLEENFTLISEIPTREDYLAMLSEADIFVLPSKKEGLPIAILEAMALEKPVVSTAVGAIPEAIIHGVTGILINDHNMLADRLADAVSLLIEDASMRQRLAKAGRHLVEEKFDAEKISKRMVEIYESQ